MRVYTIIEQNTQVGQTQKRVNQVNTQRVKISKCKMRKGANGIRKLGKMRKLGKRASRAKMSFVLSCITVS